VPTVVRFDAELDNVAGVRRSIELLEDQALVELHNGIQQAFGWMDDHLYSFWLDGRFHGDRSTEYAAPIEPEEDVATAAVAISKLGLEPGTKIAYAFDFGDEWRVGLRLTETADAEEARYPRVVA
jgi:Plasmid pRiA4b ORF-3-like protein